MSDLMAPVVDGKIPSTATTTTSEQTNTKGTTNLGQDAFLQLLICEMQNQDPLEPTTNTEWIAQLATFSQLEELQSLSKTTENSQVFSLIGKNVEVSTEDAAGNVTYKSGIVDYVTMSGGVAKVCVNGTLYSMDDIVSVIDADYLYEQNKPSVAEKVTFDFNGDEPENLTFKVDFGKDAAKAENVAIVIGNAVLSSDYVVVSGNTVTIKQEILQELEAGTYKFSVMFDDERVTTEEDVITINIYNSHPTQKEDETESGTESAEDAMEGVE